MAVKAHVREVLDRDAWDTAVWSHPQGNIFCSWLWGDYKSRTGWTVHRIAIEDEASETLALAQFHEKRKGPFRLLRVQGGPLLTGKGDRQAEAAIQSLVDHLRLGRLDLLTIDFERSQSTGAVLAVLAQGFRPLVKPVRYTLDVDLTEGLDAVRRNMEPRWRKALRRAEQWRGLSVRFLDDMQERLACFDAFSALYRDLKKRANFTNRFDCAAYRDLAAGDSHHLIVEVRDEGELVLVRIAHLSADRCTDFFTASTERARASHAATLAVWRLIERATSEGCRTFDHGGIDPTAARGVFDFKRGLTRNVVQSGPLWLFGQTPLLRNAASAYILFN